MLQNYFLAFLVGVLTQLTDWQVDEKLKLFKNAEYLTGFLYGLGAAFLAIQGPDFATLIIALAIAMLLAGKIDKPAHQLAIAAIFLVLAFYGVPKIDFIMLVAILAVAFLDELQHDFVTARKTLGKRALQPLTFIGENRLLLELFLLAYFFYSGNANYFIALFFFDFAAYRVVNVIVKRFFHIPLKTRGKHLLLDLFDCDVAALEREGRLRGFIGSLPQLLGMRQISPVFVFKHEGDAKKYDEGGLSAIVLIAESHISVHTFPAKRSCQADVFSCKAFDTKKAQSAFSEFFKAKRVRAKVVNRSETHY